MTSYVYTNKAVNAEDEDGDNFNALSVRVNNYSAANFKNETENSINPADDDQKTQPLSNFFKYYLLAIFSSIYLIYGTQNNLFGACLKELAYLMDTTSENITIGVSTQTVVFCLSTIFVNYSYKFFGFRQFQYAGAVVILIIITVLIPLLTSFSQFLILCVIIGFVIAFIESVTNQIPLKLWSQDSKIYLQICHGCYTVGSIFGPLLAAPFLSPSLPNRKANHSTSTTPSPFDQSIEPSSNSDSQDFEDFESRIYIPYLIVAFIMAILIGVMIVTQIIRPYIPEKRKLVAKQKAVKVVGEFENSKAVSNSVELTQNGDNYTSINLNLEKKVEAVIEKIELPRIYYVVFLGLTGLLLSIYACVENTGSLLMRSYLSNCDLKIESSEAAQIASIVFTATAISRLLTVIFANKLTCKILLFYNLTTFLFGYIVLTFFAGHSKFIIYLSMVIIGNGQGATYPIIFSFIENRIVITNSVQLYLLFASTIFFIFVPAIVGHYIDREASVFVFIILALSIVALIIMILIHFTDAWKRKLVRQMKEDKAALVNQKL